jgi:hypothetical protein
LERSALTIARTSIQARRNDETPHAPLLPVEVRRCRALTGNDGACGVSSLRLAWIDVHAIVNALLSKQ